MESLLQNIDHIVVLMMENRSFDHMLGWLYDEQNEPPFQTAVSGQTFEGLSGKNLSNPIPSYADQADKKEIPVSRGCSPLHPDPDPGEEYYHINTQLFGEVIPAQNREKPFNKKPYNLPSPTPATASMNGFVTDYVNNAAALLGRAPTYDEYKIIMDCFTPDQVPVISTLAREYAVCDHYHCSVPSQTFCNRSFVHSGTSNGFVVNSPYVNWLFTHAPTIYNRIQNDPRKELTWKIYYDKLDGFSFTWLIQPTIWKYQPTHMFTMEQFFADAQNGTLPSYSFIEPRLFIAHNDQHPPMENFTEVSSVAAGELLINEVYQALRNGKNWERTMFILTYDEHGGCYDHVPPPTAVPPDPSKPEGQYGFHFDRLGIRVPCVIVSPYTEAGTIINSTHDHTSIIKTVTNRWDLPHLTKRDKAAVDLSAALNRIQPRTDFPKITPLPYVPRPYPENEPISGLQRAILMAIAGMQGINHIEEDKHMLDRLKHSEEIVAEELEIIFRIKTVGDAVKFIRQHFETNNPPTGCRDMLKSQLHSLFGRKM